MSSASSNTSRRVRQAIAGSDVSENPPAPAPSEAESQVSSESGDDAAPRQSRRSDSRSDNRSGSRSALTLQRHRSHSMDNRPVDPSPIQVSHTVAMGGQRPIGVSDGQRGPDFSGSQTILNRPIAPNTTAQDDEMLGYLD